MQGAEIQKYKKKQKVHKNIKMKVSKLREQERKKGSNKNM
jgi:hypothetical protein